MIKVFNYIAVFFMLICVNQNVFSDAPTYKVVDLGLKESDQSEAIAINDNGLVVGMYWFYGTNYFYLWNEDDGVTLIHLPVTSVIVALNNSGQIAGNYKDDSGYDRGFIWDPYFGFTDIGTLGGDFTRVYDMNDFGAIVGESENSTISLVDGQKECHAFVWQYGCMEDLGALRGDLGLLGDRSVATSINNSGQIIGTAASIIAHKRKCLRTNNRAVFWQFYAVETISGIELRHIIEEVDSTLEPHYTAVATSVNNNGIATFGDDKKGFFAVNLAEKDNILFFLNDFSSAFAVTDNEDIYILQYGPSNNLGFLKNNDSREYCFNNNFYDYVDYQKSFGSPAQWKPNSFIATGFNNNRKVVGTAINIYGEWHAVLLVPDQPQPEPYPIDPSS